MSDNDFILEDKLIKEHFDSTVSQSNSNFQSTIEQDRKDSKIFLKQFNTDFNKYKSYVNGIKKKYDSAEERKLNNMYNQPDKYLSFPYNVYTRFPMIIGIMLIIFGIMMCFFRTN
jgi:hypothetical protein